jgi:surface protein
MSIRYASTNTATSKDVPATIPKVVDTWVRPSDWLTLTPPTASESKLVGLVAVTDDDSNFLALSATSPSGTYSVDWGDGTVDTGITSNVSVYHQYNYSAISSSTISSRGYKQVIVTVTAAGQNMPAINLQVKYLNSAIYSGSWNAYTAKWLEVYYSAGANASSSYAGLRTGGTIAVNMNMLEAITVVKTGIMNTGLQFSNNYNLQYVSLNNCSWSTTTSISAFANCYKLQTVYMDASTANATSALTSTATFFNNCYNLRSIPKFNTSNVTDMSTMFGNCWQLSTIPILNTSNVTNMSLMFYQCRVLQYVPTLDTAKVSNMNTTFGGCTILKSAPLFNTSNVTTTAQMFATCPEITTVPLYNTANVTDMSYMFQGCTKLESVPAFNTVKVTNMNATFNGCQNLQTVPTYNTSNVTNMVSMFNGCNSLNSAPPLDTGNITSTQQMFLNCYSLITAPSYNINKVTTFDSMFSGCNNLATVGGFSNTGNVLSATQTFFNCIALTTVPALNLINATGTTQTFNGCASISKQQLSNIGKVNLDVSSGSLSKTQIENICNNSILGNAASKQLTITSNWGADPGVTKAVTVNANTYIAMANTVGVTTGMICLGTGLSPGSYSVTFDDATDTVGLTAHGLANGTKVAFNAITSTTGIALNTVYYVVNTAANTFQVSATLGGAALPLTTNGTGSVRYTIYVSSVTANSSITITAKPYSTGATTATIRPVDIGPALLKNWTVVG